MSEGRLEGKNVVISGGAAGVGGAASKFWDDVAETGEVAAKVVKIFKDYDAIRQSAKGIYTCG